MLSDQALNLSFGRDVCKRRVSRSQPRRSFVSSNAPSAFNLLAEMIALRGIGSDFMMGRQIVWMERGMAASSRRAFPGRSGPAATMSSR